MFCLANVDSVEIKFFSDAVNVSVKLPIKGFTSCLMYLTKVSIFFLEIILESFLGSYLFSNYVFFMLSLTLKVLRKYFGCGKTLKIQVQFIFRFYSMGCFFMSERHHFSFFLN